MPSYYDDIRLSPSVEDPRRLVFVATKDAGDPPDELVTLRQQYDQAARVAGVLFSDDKALRKTIFSDMHLAADRGLRGPNYSLVDGRANLTEVQGTITDSALSVRDQRMRHYSRLAIYLGIIPLLLGMTILHTEVFAILSLTSIRPTPDWLPNFVAIGLLIVSGASICVWAEFVTRMSGTLQFEQLLNLDLNRWNPLQRVAITVGISFIFAFVLAHDAVQIGLGGILLNQFSKDQPELALAVGGVTGFAFAAVRDILYRLKPEERR